MKSSTLILRGLTYYWRTNAAVVLGVATAVAVLAGALLVGDSVRGSLRDLVLLRLGRTDHVIVSAGFFREQLAGDLQTHPDFPSLFDNICPLVTTQGFVAQQSGGGRAGQVRVYGVDDRFWQFHGVGSVTGPGDRDALISPALAEELGAEAGVTILVRVQRPSDVPLESLHARKENLGRTLRATVRAVLPRERLGEFSLEAQQGEIRAVFLPLTLLQRELEVGSRVNALLVSAKSQSAAAAPLEKLLRSRIELEDLGLKLRVLEARNAIVLEADGGLLDDEKANAATEAARDLGLQAQPVFTYLANSLRSGGRETPYSLVTAMNLPAITSTEPRPIMLNDWAARDLRVAIGDPVTMEYYVWEEPGRLATRTAEFRVAGVVPINTGDRDLAPVYPGITDSKALADWDPPFPIDLRKVRRIDEEYWENYRTTPKAYIPLAVGQQLWRSRYGAMTSIRLAPGSGQPIDDVRQDYARLLRQKIDPLATSIAVKDVRTESLQASRGATDFGEYFVYFSFFLVVSALMLAALFFKLSIEQRAREVGLLRAVGFKQAAVRRILMSEGLLLSAAGAAAGMLCGVAYAYAMVTGLRTWWVDAVGTTALALHVSPISLAAGALGGIVAAMACIWATLRSLASVSERRLLVGQLTAETFEGRHAKRGSVLIAAIALAGIGVALMAAATGGLIDRAGAFFGAGTALLASCLCVFVFWFRLRDRIAIEGQGWRPVSRLGLRNAMYRPARSVLSIATIASATFILISVDAFRRDDRIVTTDPHSGTGGYSLLVDSLLPIVHDPTSREGRETLGLANLDLRSIEPFRVRPGDDASCLNLYEPRNPRILAPTDSFIAAGRFAFQASLASNEAERANPWLLLHREEPDGAVPVIADANSMTYVLHRKLGEDIVIPRGERSIRLRLVAALDDSIFQGELLMSQANFLKLFPEEEGYRFLLIETPPEHAAASAIEEALSDFGADAKSTAERLAEFHRVENTYLSTFQMLGGLGLLLGTVGLAAVLLRNVLERRRELAMLRALGYKQPHFLAMALAENALLLISGLLTGAVCALLAIAPVVLDRGGRLPAMSLVVLLGGVLAAGLITSLLATAIALRSPLLPALRAE
jgi:ABC-type lipoprotein release transport system permease subunit